MIYRIALLVLLTVVSGCAGKGALNDLGSSLGLISAYDASIEDFRQGRMMEARTRILTIKKSDEDYKKARSFLTRKVNPARLKLLRYYARKGKIEEGNHYWARAAEAYKTASGLSIKPKALLRYQRNMVLKVRQLRQQTIDEQLKKEDEAWLKWINAYNPPRGLAGTDEAFELANVRMNEAMDDKASEMWSLAEHYESQGLPEMAWVYASSYLRLVPDSEKGGRLKKAMAHATPQGLELGGLSEKVTRKKTRKSKDSKEIKVKVSKLQVTQFMEQQKWILARTYAQRLRRQGHVDADRLLKVIEQKNKSLAARDFENGKLAFRLEKIDKAVTFWKQAVKRMPKEQIYKDSLYRGKQIQERLNALRVEESPSEKDAKVEE
ncbi:MAG: hypothetical protein R8M45_02385 [Ghiorsea sp.]